MRIAVGRGAFPSLPGVRALAPQLASDHQVLDLVGALADLEDVESQEKRGTGDSRV